MPEVALTKGLTATHSAACTSACTSQAENAKAGPIDATQGQQSDVGTSADPIAKLAAALLALSSADSARLAALLTQQQPKNGEQPPLPPA